MNEIELFNGNQININVLMKEERKSVDNYKINFLKIYIIIFTKKRKKWKEINNNISLIRSKMQ